MCKIPNFKKWKVNKPKKIILWIIRKNITGLSKTCETVLFIANVGRKSKSTPYSLKHNGALPFDPLKVAETFNILFTNVEKRIAKRIPKGKKYI